MDTSVEENVQLIDCLPTELLASIFLALVESWHRGLCDAAEPGGSPHPLGAIVQVCRRWNEVARESPELWSHINVNNPSQRAVAASLALAKDAPLHLFTPWCSARNKAIDMFMPHLHHTKALELYCFSNWVPFLESQSHPRRPLHVIAPLLETMKVVILVQDESEEDDDSRLHGQRLKENLRSFFQFEESGLKYLSLSVPGYPIPFAALPAGLHYLELTNKQLYQVYPIFDMLPILKSTPHLRCLHLCGNYVGGPSFASQDDPIQLPRLEELALKNASLLNIGMVLNGLEYPPLIRLTVVSMDRIGYADPKAFESLYDTIQWLCQDVEAPVTDSLVTAFQHGTFAADWERRWPDGYAMGPIIHLGFPFIIGYDIENSVLMPKLCRAFTTNSLCQLTVRMDRQIWADNIWTQTFGGTVHGRASALTTITLDAEDIRPFITALTAVRIHVDKATGTKSKVPMFPALSTIILRHVDFASSEVLPYDGVILQDSFLEMLEFRSQLGVGVKHLRLDDCFAFYEGHELESCRNLVDKLEVLRSEPVSTRRMIRRKNLRMS